MLYRLTAVSNLKKVTTDSPQDAPIDEERRKFILASTIALGGIGALCALTPFISSWFPSAKVKAQGPQWKLM